MLDNQPKKYDDFILVGTNKIHTTAIIGDNVVLGNNNIIGAYSVIGGYGGITGDFASKGKVVIGNDNVIHNHVEIKSPYRTEKTRIGSNNLIMDYINIGHDCIIENHCVLATGSRLAGCCHIESFVSFGMNALVKQRTRIGHTTMIGMGGIVLHDLDSECVYVGQPVKKLKRNEIGINRRINIQVSHLYETPPTEEIHI